MTQKAEL